MHVAGYRPGGFFFEHTPVEQEVIQDKGSTLCVFLFVFGSLLISTLIVNVLERVFIYLFFLGVMVSCSQG